MIERRLPELLSGDLFATAPGNDPLERFASDIIHAQTFHWGLVVHPIDGDYEIMEAVGSKGAAVGLLSKMYGDIPIRLYRVKSTYRPSIQEVERTADTYGRSLYALKTLPAVAIWWIAFSLLRFLQFLPPALDPDSAICTALVTMVWRDLGVDLVPQYAYPTPDMLEKSEHLECIYKEF